jgi:hypothetical protein
MFGTLNCVAWRSCQSDLMKTRRFSSLFIRTDGRFGVQTGYESVPIVHVCSLLIHFLECLIVNNYDPKLP